MRRLLLCIILILTAGAAAFAQIMPDSLQTEVQKTQIPKTKAPKPEFQYSDVARPYRNEISISAGYSSIPKLKTSIGMRLTTLFLFTTGSQLEGTYSTGALAIEYMRYTKNGRFAFGGIAGIEHIYSNFSAIDGEEEVEPTDRVNFITVLPAAKVIWLHRKHIGFYTHLSAGLISESYDGANLKLSVQLDLLGMDFGWERLRGFIQIGIGDLGLVQGGLKTCF